MVAVTAASESVRGNHPRSARHCGRTAALPAGVSAAVEKSSGVVALRRVVRRFFFFIVCPCCRSEQIGFLKQIKEGKLISFQWEEDKNTDAYFQFEIVTLDLSNHVGLVITDFTTADDKEDAILLWNSQVETLLQDWRHVIASGYCISPLPMQICASEACPGGQRPGVARPGQAQCDTDLTACRPRQELAQRHQICIAALGQPAPPRDELIAKVAQVRDGAAERGQPKAQKE